MVGESGDGVDAGVAKFFREVGKDANQLVFLSVGRPFVEAFGLVLLELVYPGVFPAAGDGAQQLGDGRKFIVFSQVDGVYELGFGEEVQQDQDLFFGEDPFLFAFCGVWDWGFFCDLGMNVQFVLREGIVVLMVFCELEVDVGVLGFRKERRPADLLHGIVKRFVEISFRGDEKAFEDLGMIEKECAVKIFNLRVLYTHDSQEASNEPDPGIFYNAVFAVMQNIAKRGR